MENRLERTEMLLGKLAMQRLAAARVAVFGLGGVGSYVVEALARSGVGALDLIDKDTYELSNMNRQLYATYETLGQKKVDAAAVRVAAIASECTVRTWPVFFLPETADRFPFAEYDYVVDAIDNVTGKIELVLRAQQAGTPIICSMGAGNKMDPAQFRAADIYETSVDPLARIMRRELRRRGVEHLKVVYSTEPPLPSRPADAEPATAAAADAKFAGPAAAVQASGAEPALARRTAPVPGSNAFVPAACGLVLAAEVVRDLSGFPS